MKAFRRIIAAMTVAAALLVGASPAAADMDVSLSAPVARDGAESVVRQVFPGATRIGVGCDRANFSTFSCDTTWVGPQGNRRYATVKIKNFRTATEGPI